MKMNLLFHLVAVAGFCTLISLADAAGPDATSWLSANAAPPARLSVKPKSTLRWIDGKYLTMEGRASTNTVTDYGRLNKKYQEQVTSGVWNNASCASGVALRFVTNSPEISVSWGQIKNAMAHMAWTGSGGVDLYAWENNQWVWRATGQPEGPDNQKVLLTGQPVKATEYLLFLPLYSKVDKVEVGIEQTANITAAPARYDGKLPIIYYGTSITQGACASRTGMVHTSILRRWLDYPTVNLGFSGSGKCEPIMADVLAEMPAAIYVIETVPNMDAAMVRDRAVPFITALRAKQPDTTILMVESPNQKNADRNAEWRRAFDQMTSDGLSNLHYLANTDMYDAREEATVDGTHPTDLGFYNMALKYEPVLKSLLNSQNPSAVDQFQQYNNK